MVLIGHALALQQNRRLPPSAPPLTNRTSEFSWRAEMLLILLIQHALALYANRLLAPIARPLTNGAFELDRILRRM